LLFVGFLAGVVVGFGQLTLGTASTPQITADGSQQKSFAQTLAVTSGVRLPL